MTREHEQAIQILQKEYLCVDRDCDIERSCGKCDLKKSKFSQGFSHGVRILMK